MKYNNLGVTDAKISAITLGTWGIGGAGWGQVERSTSINTIQMMIDKGINSIDTAPVYGFFNPNEKDLGFGYSEELVGEAIRGRRNEIFITSKCGLNYKREEGPRSMYKSMTRDEIITGCEDSLRRLGTDHIDLLLIHWPDNKTPFEESAAAMDELKAAGKIRYFGLSNFSVEDTLKFDSILHVDAVQLPYSMIERKDENTLQRLHDANIGTMTYASLGAGILTGRYRTVPDFGAMDTRTSFYHYFEEPAFSAIQNLLSVMDGIALEHNVPLTQIALEWSMSHSYVDTAIIGVSKPSHAEALDGIFTWNLTAEEISLLDNTIAEIKL